MVYYLIIVLLLSYQLKILALILYIRPVEAQLPRIGRVQNRSMASAGSNDTSAKSFFFHFYFKKKEKNFWRKVSGSSRTILPNHLTRT
jgi:hypothetical protein